MHVTCEYQGRLCVLIPHGVVYKGRFYGRAKSSWGWLPVQLRMDELASMPFTADAETAPVR